MKLKTLKHPSHFWLHLKPNKKKSNFFLKIKIWQLEDQKTQFLATFKINLAN
jgi:hypothetical protein